MTTWDWELARLIDHTNLRANATETDIVRLCDEVRRYEFASAVVNPHYLATAVRELSGSGIPVCSVVSFPLGADTAAAKVVQAERLIDGGAGEVDMVMNVGAFLSNRRKLVMHEIEDVSRVCRDRAVLKLIIETAYLSDEEIDIASIMGVEGGCDFIKTSTGFAPRGASLDDVGRILAATGGRVGIKASGGIRTRRFARALVRAGATRLGSSASISVIGAAG